MAHAEIYALVDPRDGEIRYVGKSWCAKKRFQCHVARTHKRHASRDWIDELREAGLRPELNILEVCGEEWPEREKHWIAHYRAQGARLFNIDDGGRGDGWARLHRTPKLPHEKDFNRVVHRYRMLAAGIEQAGDAERAEMFRDWADSLMEARALFRKHGRNALTTFYRLTYQQYAPALGGHHGTA